MTKPIVGIMGQARAGKDSIAQMLEMSYGFARIGLADPMKRFCAEVFDFSHAQLYGDEREKKDERYPRKVLWCDQDPPFMGHKESCYRTDYLTARYALQTLGTEWGRDCYNNVWIDLGIRTAKKLLEGPDLQYSAQRGLHYDSRQHGSPRGVVFSDLRFRNEFDAVKNAGGILVRVKRPGADGKTGVIGHASEEEQKSIPDSEFHLVIDNNGTLLELYQKVDEQLAPIIKRTA